jgi:phosphoglycolate phosphatase-like HAD superfamily hydrolase
MKKLIYCFDLDGTLCTQTAGLYESAIPFDNAIAAVNRLYEEGHTIIIDTARGSTSKIDWTEITRQQLSSWRLKYHLLRVGKKIHADVFVDDKAINASAWRLMNV